MKTLYLLLSCFSFSCYVSGQQQLFYVCAGYELLKINLTTCDTAFIGLTDSISLTDIAIAPDHRLYGIDGSRLYEVDTSNAHMTLISNLTALNGHLQAINSLVADSSGNLLTLGY